MNEREQFEAWMSDGGRWPRAAERDGKGEYVLAQTATAWNVWQARAALAASPVPATPTALTDSAASVSAPAQAVIAWVRQHPDGTLTDEILLNSFIDPVRKSSGAWLPLSLPAPAPSVEAQADNKREQFEAWWERTGKRYPCDTHRKVLAFAAWNAALKESQR